MDLKFRQLLAKDLVELEESCKRLGFPVPDLQKAIFSGVIVDRNDDFIAFGQVQPIVESILVESDKRSKTERVAALRYLMIEAMLATKKANHSSLHGFVKDAEFSKILKKHYGFKTCTGEALFLNL